MTDDHPLPADLARPRRVVPKALPGIVIGGILLLIDAALLALFFLL